MKVLVTGSAGTIGRAVTDMLRDRGHHPVLFDLPQNVLNPLNVQSAAECTEWCIHLAAHKHAPLGEELPADVAELNILGTRNIVEAFGPRVVLASTCKAADPMTCYGASKLIAERIVLNAGGRVVRLVNVLGSSGSVVDLWRQLPASAPLPVTDCVRMWMALDAAACLFVDALDWPTGRYAPEHATATVADLAEALHPGRPTVPIPPRRGDRIRERLLGEYEHPLRWRDGAIRIEHPADLPAAHAALAQTG